MNAILDDLIAEQAHDDALGSYQPPERGVMHLGVWESSLATDGLVSRIPERGCAIHGLASVTSRGCRVCANDRARLRYRTNRIYRERKVARERARYAADPESSRARSRSWRQRVRPEEEK